MAMVLCDTNILISAFNGREDTVEKLNQIGLSEIVLSAVTVMELFQGMGNKSELAKIKKQIRFYDVVQIDRNISEKAIEFVEKFKLSHGLQIPDAIIGATGVVYQIPRRILPAKGTHPRRPCPQCARLQSGPIWPVIDARPFS